MLVEVRLLRLYSESTPANPLAIEAMKEVGIDISKQRPKIITEDMIR